MLELLLGVLLVVLLLSVLPTWPHSRSWGHGPSVVLVVLLVALLVFMLLRYRI